MESRLAWLRGVMEWEGDLKDSKEFIDALKTELYSHELLVFTPRGKVISLPPGSTPVDFAYAIHSEVGNHCVGARVNSRIVPLTTTLAVGDVVEIRVSCKANENGTLTVTAAILNEERFYECYEILSASTLELTEFSNTRVSGVIECDRDGLLYTSIPQNGNWFAEVDGQDAEVKLVGDAMIGIMLQEGTHEVTFTYRNEAFSLGWKISLMCLAVFGLMIFLTRKKK